MEVIVSNVLTRIKLIVIAIKMMNDTLCRKTYTLDHDLFDFLALIICLLFLFFLQPHSGVLVDYYLWCGIAEVIIILSVEFPAATKNLIITAI